MGGLVHLLLYLWLPIACPLVTGLTFGGLKEFIFTENCWNGRTGVPSETKCGWGSDQTLETLG